MKTGPQANIISWNQHQEELCASAARISTTPGGAQELFEGALGSEKNRPLIAKVLRSGHKSTLEHAVFTIALCDVSVLAEQFFIEHRLASFTVKSRRYVDFGSQGYYVPPELDGESLAAYRRYMDALFHAYGLLLERGVPKEDARFLLPYALHSNFYCTVNARELAHLLRAMARGNCELRDLAGQLRRQLEELFPCLLPELEDPAGEEAGGTQDAAAGEAVFLRRGEAGSAVLLGGPRDPLAVLCAAYRASHPGVLELPALDELLRTPRARELEQLVYTFQISGATLSGITHIVRHRMQSVIVPPIALTNRYILPPTLSGEAEALYTGALREAHAAARALLEDPRLRPHSPYLAPSGSMLDVMTTLNARELRHFIRLRTCNRAQWEIRDIATGMLRQLRASCPDLFGLLGPGCYLDGRCPEGAMTCGKREQVAARFAGSLEDGQ